MTQNKQWIFSDPQADKRLCEILQAFVQEYGPESVLVRIPPDWIKHTEPGSLGQVQLFFNANRAVIIEVHYRDKFTNHLIELYYVQPFKELAS